MGQEPSYYRNDCVDLPGILTVDRGHRPASAGIIAFAPAASENAGGCSELMLGKSFAHVGAEPVLSEVEGCPHLPKRIVIPELNASP